MAIQSKTLQGWVRRDSNLDRPVPLSQRVRSHPTLPHIAIIASLVLVFLGNNYGWFLWVVRSATASTYIVQPIVWMTIGAGAIYIHRTRAIPFIAGFKRTPTTVLIALFHISTLIIVGLLSGFANSPYSHQIPNMMLNAVFLGTTLIGVELARSLLLRSWGDRDHRIAIWVVGIAFGLMSVPLAQLTNLQGPDRTVHVLGTLVVPEVSIHVLTTYIALRGGLLPALTYRAVLTGFEWYSPILPNSTGFISAFVAITVVYVGYRTFASVLSSEVKTVEAIADQEESTLKRIAKYSWPAATILSVALIWFSMGLFPIKPTSVLGQSMTPAHHRGDLLIMKSVDPATLQTGDVIEYRIGDIAIVHRIIDVDSSPAGLFFFTQGDNNEIADPTPVSPSQVTGKLAFEIPNAGWPGIWVKQSFSFLKDGT